MKALLLKVDDAQYAKWQSAAEKQGTNLSEWIRTQCNAIVNGNEDTNPPAKPSDSVPLPVGMPQRQVEERGDVPRVLPHRALAPRPHDAKGEAPARHMKFKVSGTCAHGFSVVEGATACVTCNQFGLQMREQHNTSSRRRKT